LENPVVPVDNVTGWGLAAGNSARSTKSILNSRSIIREEEALVLSAF
jgi:hypothetical protein